MSGGAGYLALLLYIELLYMKYIYILLSFLLTTFSMFGIYFRTSVFP